MSWRLRVVHTTGYSYEEPVTASFNEARLSPRSDHHQNVIVNRVETEPVTRSYRYDDYFGTAVTAFDLHAPHTSLVVTGSSIVETDSLPLPAPEEVLDWKDLASPRITDRYDEWLSKTTYVLRDRALGALAKRLAKGLDPMAAVIAISRYVHEEMSYVPGTTGVHTSAVEAWKERKGVCQDYAHLTLLLLRSIGIPSRYVSGYLHPSKDAVIGETVVGQSHAWIEAWTGSWWGYDPTNATEIGEQHVSVGLGRDYDDVPPLKGIISGGRSTDLDVLAEVTRLA